ncbi:MAG: hypothetical protein ABIA74_05240 [bacterium]
MTKQKKDNLRAIDYNEKLIESLKDHKHAVEYLNAALEESLKGDIESQKLLLGALKNVANVAAAMGFNIRFH